MDDRSTPNAHWQASTLLDRPTRRHPRAIVAMIAALAVLISVVLPLSPALADFSRAGTDDVTWSQTGTQAATGALPGNLAGLPGAQLTTQASSSVGFGTGTISTSGSGSMGASWAGYGGGGDANCVKGKAQAVRQILTCETFTATVTLPQPLIDPIVPIASETTRYWSTTESTLKGCQIGWMDGGVTSVNGAPASTSNTTVVQQPTAGWTSSGPASWALSHSAVNSNNCVRTSTTDQPGMVQLKGKISSYSFTFYVRTAVVIAWTSTYCPFISAPSQLFTSLLVPVVDLAVSKSAPATVQGNGKLDWNISVANLGPAPSHGFVVKDAVPSNVTNPQVVSGPQGCVISGRDLVCAIAPPGCTTTASGSVSTVANLSCNDPLSATQAVLAPGSSSTIVLSATAPATNGAQVVNTVTVAGVDQDPNVSNNSSTATTTVVQAPSLSIAKTAALAPGATGKAGDTVNYTFTATNTGNQTLTGVTVVDQLAGMSALTYQWPAAPGVLTPGQSVTATATYSIAQKDVDAGSVNNLATATGKAPNGASVPSGPAQATVPLKVDPELTLTKRAVLTPGQTGVAGDVVQYTFTVTNTGRVTVNGVKVSDRLAGLGALTYQWPGAAGVLQPGQTVTATASYTLKQADVDAGSVSNVAVANGTTPSGTPVASNEVPATVPLDRTASLNVTKTAKLASGQTGKAGDTVNYTFSATNTGPVTATNVSISDQLPGISAITYSWPGAAGTLAPGQQAGATATYTLKQADVDAGSVRNVATATGKAPDGSTVDAPPAQAVVPVDGTPALTLTKTGALASGATGAAGDSVEYRFTATNTGTVTLTSVTISDRLAGLSAITYAWPGATGVLAPGQAVTATASYTVTQADLDAGSIQNVAAATAVDPAGNTVPGDPAQAVVPLAPAPALSISKVGSLAAGATGLAGDTVEYRFTVTNTGTVTLSSVSVSDALAGLSAITYSWPGSAGVLAPGEQATATATYELTQADVDAGAVANTATASGTTPQGVVVPAGPAEAVVPLDPAPGLTVVKQATLGSGATGAVGDLVRYAFTVTNTGGVTLSSVAIDDQLDGMSALAYTWPGAEGTLAPGQSATATATYTITQSDVDAGSVSNLATGTGTTPDGETVPAAPAEAVVPLNPTAGLALTKTAVFSADSSGAAGDAVEYTFSVTNTGGVTLDGVSISDRLAGMSAPEYSWPGAAGVLAPGQTATARATYIVTAADVEAGSVGNVATATGRTPSGAGVTSPEAPATVPLPSERMPSGTPGIDLTKSGSLAEGALGQVGDTVYFTFVVTNSGTVPLTSVSISDPLDGISPVRFDAWPGTVGTLEPGQAVTATATYRLTADDVARGSVVNTAWAHGTHEEEPIEVGSNTVAVPLPPQGLPSGSQPMVATTTGVPVFDTLAHTGLDALPFGFGALALLLAGGVLLIVRRRARES